ncbi:MAG: carboxylating nicotinate-nucleotide diphosphorylase, partial [Nitrososphaerota archaeon]
GIEEAVWIARFFSLKINYRAGDGESVKPGAKLLELEGEARRILQLERVLLNIIGHMSGVATETRKALTIARSRNPNVKVSATRKTLPGLRLLEKKAVIIGGGDPHRYDLSDMVLIKDNHIKIVGDVGEAVRRARAATSFTKKVEVEVGSLEEAVKAVENGADIVMLDNLTPEEVDKIVRSLKDKGLRDKAIIEASGGINLDNIQKYAESGVDVISMGAITDSAKAIDVSLEVEEVLG